MRPGLGVQLGRTALCAIAGRRARAGFRIQRNMPLICPTCQMASSHARGRLLLCMGLFLIFWQRAPSKGRSPTLSAVLPATERCDTPPAPDSIRLQSQSHERSQWCCEWRANHLYCRAGAAGGFGTQPNNHGCERPRLHPPITAPGPFDPAGPPAQNRKKP